MGNEKKRLIVGVGSFNGNDQIGWRLIDALKDNELNNNLSFFKSKSDGSDWYHEIKDHEQIIFIDAMLSNKDVDSIGDIIEIPLDILRENTTYSQNFQSSSHSMSLIDSITMAENLALLPIPVRIIGICISMDTTTMPVTGAIKSQIEKKIYDS